MFAKPVLFLALALALVWVVALLGWLKTGLGDSLFALSIFAAFGLFEFFTFSGRPSGACAGWILVGADRTEAKHRLNENNCPGCGHTAPALFCSQPAIEWRSAWLGAGKVSDEPQIDTSRRPQSVADLSLIYVEAHCPCTILDWAFTFLGPLGNQIPTKAWLGGPML